MTYPLFQSYSLGSHTLKNRAVMAPMTRCRALGNIPNALMAEYYGQRSGAGMIITEGVAPSKNGLGYARIPGLFSDEQVEGWKATTNAVHDGGSLIFAQLMHTGRVSHPDNMPPGSKMVSSSAVQAKGDMWTDTGGMQPHPEPHAMSLEEIESTQVEFEEAAANAIRAGFDGVELHGANGYLLEQFINPTVNERTDDYGGSPEKRARFVIEVMQRVAKRIGAGNVGLRLSPYGFFNDMGSYEGVQEQYVLIAKAAKDLGLAYLHTIRGKHVEPQTLAAIKDAFGGPFMLNGGYDSTQAQAAIDAKEADLISFGSSFLANPDLVERMRSGAALNSPQPDLFYSAEAKGYTDYPVAD
jgi:N-ethylmaleimide reductase